MAHKTLIGGTAYEIGGGKTLVNGTAYSIDKGKTLVGGTVYSISFSSLAVDLVSKLIDFEYNDNGDGTATLISWKGTYNGASSTELIIPDDSRIIL